MRMCSHWSCIFISVRAAVPQSCPEWGSSCSVWLVWVLACTGGTGCRRSRLSPSLVCISQGQEIPLTSSYQHRCDIVWCLHVCEVILFWRWTQAFFPISSATRVSNGLRSFGQRDGELGERLGASRPWRDGFWFLATGVSWTEHTAFGCHILMRSLSEWLTGLRL